jgi:tetratricopeptide (TPR) repeat protein
VISDQLEDSRWISTDHWSLITDSFSLALMRFFPLEVRLCLGLAVATLAAFWPVLGYDFINYDDGDYVSENPDVRVGLSGPGVHWAFTTFHAGNWHPLTWLSLQLDATLFGPGSLLARGCHLTNLLLHTANAILLLIVLRRLTGALWRSALVAALFALHPLHVESVAWVAERKDVLSTFFWILTLGAYGWYVRRPGPARYLAVVAPFGLGLLAKPMLVTLPCVLLLLDYWPLGRLSGSGTPPARAPWRRRFAEKVPLLLLALASCVVTWYAQRGAGAVLTLEVVSPRLRLSNALESYVTYLGQTLWPQDLAVFYPYTTAALTPLRAGGAALLLAAVTALCCWQWRRPYLIVGWLWYLGTLVPVIGLVQVGSQSHADRYTYVPLIGVFVMLAWGLNDLAQLRPNLRPVIGVAACALPLLCLAQARAQVAVWAGSQALWEHALKVTTNNHIAHHNLGVALGDPEKAEEHLRAALRIQPKLVQARCNLAEVLQQQGKEDEARAAFEEVLDDSDATPEMRARAHYVIGLWFVRWREAAAATEHFRQAAALAPQEGRYRFGLGSVCEERGSLSQAEVEYEAGRRLSPDWPERARRIAWARGAAVEQKAGDDRLALFYARQACRGAATPDANALDTLAVALAAGGDFSEAQATARRAQVAADAAGDDQLAGQIAERIRLFEQGRPYRSK